MLHNTEVSAYGIMEIFISSCSPYQFVEDND